MRKIDPQAVPSVLVSSHGPFSWGDTPEIAVHYAVILDELAFIAYGSKVLQPQTGSMQNELLDKHYLRKNGKDSYYGQT